MASGYAHAAPGSGTVHALRPSDRQQVWNADTGGRIYAAEPLNAINVGEGLLVVPVGYRIGAVSGAVGAAGRAE